MRSRPRHCRVWRRRDRLVRLDGLVVHSGRALFASAEEEQAQDDEGNEDCAAYAGADTGLCACREARRR
jgi:hypothetical protein